MLIQENATDSRIIIFDWINIKIKSSVVFPGQLIQKVSISPTDKDVLVTTGLNHFRAWKILDGQFKPL
jgi:hypothetical protein